MADLTRTYDETELELVETLARSTNTSRGISIDEPVATDGALSTSTISRGIPIDEPVTADLLLRSTNTSRGIPIDEPVTADLLLRSTDTSRGIPIDEPTAVSSALRTATLGRTTSSPDIGLDADPAVPVRDLGRSSSATETVEETVELAESFLRKVSFEETTDSAISRIVQTNRRPSDTITTQDYVGGLPGSNLSFEVAGTSQGSADDWSTVLASEEEGIGTFNDLTVTWDSAESFEKGFRLPMYVHMPSETDPQLVTEDDATDETSALLLVDDLGKTYQAHLEDLTRHLAFDYYSILYMVAPSTLAMAIVFANAIKSMMYNTGVDGNPQGHLDAWPGAPAYVPRAHRKQDIVNRIVADDATEINSLCTLANEIKVKLNLHIELEGYGLFNESARFAFSVSDLQASAFPGGLTYETFGRTWSIGAMVDSGKLSAESDLVMADADWAEGHEQFLDNLDFLRVQYTTPDRFEKNWSLPGTGLPTNDNFWLRFYDKVNEEWRIPDTLRDLGIIEGFVTGWKNCEIGESKYYNSFDKYWRFLDPQLDPSGFDSYEYATCNLASLPPSLGSNHNSPNLYIEIVTQFTSSGYFQMLFLDYYNVQQTCYWFVTVDDTAGTTISTVGLTSSPTGPRYEFRDYFYIVNTIQQITPEFGTTTGRARWMGASSLQETFEGTWPLTLE